MGLGSKRFGAVNADIETVMNAIADIWRLERIADRLDAVANWTELLETP